MAYDLMLFLKYFVKQKHFFTFSSLNKRIRCFPYKDREKLDQPCPVSESAHKIFGQATQNWLFLRLLPLLIGIYV